MTIWQLVACSYVRELSFISSGGSMTCKQVSKVERRPQNFSGKGL